MTFEQEFKDRMAEIEERAKAAGSNLTQLCKDTGIARATPDRYRKTAPLTVRIIDKLEARLAEIEAGK